MNEKVDPCQGCVDRDRKIAELEDKLRKRMDELIEESQKVMGLQVDLQSSKEGTVGEDRIEYELIQQIEKFKRSFEYVPGISVSYTKNGKRYTWSAYTHQVARYTEKIVKQILEISKDAKKTPVR